MKQTLADQNRACEIFVNARKDIGDDLTGFSLIDLLADQSGWPLDTCRELAVIVVERCECSERIRIKYGEPDATQKRITQLAQVAYHGYGVSVDFKAFNGDPMPAWDELPDRIKRGWRASVVDLLLEYQVGTWSVANSGETIINSEHHFSAGMLAGFSMRMVTPAGEPGKDPRMIIERHIQADDLHAGVGFLALNRDEAHELVTYLTRTFAQGFWRE